jgi:hypothetical protein
VCKATQIAVVGVTEALSAMRAKFFPHITRFIMPCSNTSEKPAMIYSFEMGHATGRVDLAGRRGRRNFAIRCVIR